jgi:hypothetical protein
MVLNRREFCAGALLSGAAALPLHARGQKRFPSATMREPMLAEGFQLALENVLDHPFYAWPETLLCYPVSESSIKAFQEQSLVESESGHQIPFQLAEVEGKHYLCLLSELAAGRSKHFHLAPGRSARPAQAVRERVEGNSIVLDSGKVQVKIPKSQTLQGAAPGPIQQMSRGGAWCGSSHLSFANAGLTRVETTAAIRGPLLTEYRVTYFTDKGWKYVATVSCMAGYDFVRLSEDMEDLPPSQRGEFAFLWTGCRFTHRQAPNNPFAFPVKVHGNHRYDEYPWEKIGDPLMSTHIGMLSAMTEDGEWAVSLGTYQPWPAFTVVTSANFWDERSNDAVGILIDRPELWNDHEYAIWHSDAKLAVRFSYRDEGLAWKWPIGRGTRSTCLTFYDHARDVEQMSRLEELSKGVVWSDGYTYKTQLFPTSHLLYLQNMYGTLNLNQVKDWALTYPEKGRVANTFFKVKPAKSAADIDREFAGNEYTNQLPLSGIRQNDGYGPVASRQILDRWIVEASQLYGSMDERQRKRVTAVFLLMAYVHAGEAYMPMVQMLSGHPNFLADVKSLPAAMGCLFAEHSEAGEWSAEFDKYLELNTRYHSRPSVDVWGTAGGRWTENIGTYVWGFIRPTVRAAYLLQLTDGKQHLANSQMLPIADWLLNALSAPFAGESEATIGSMDMHEMHTWGMVLPGSVPRRVYPPIGAHSERRNPPRELWYLGSCLRNFAPLVAEHLMWAARPDDDAIEIHVKPDFPWQVMYDQPENRGTNPHLRTCKYTGYGVVLRAAVDTPQEISIHLQQIDDGPNYRWGVAAEGGCGVVYFFANGKGYSHNGPEDQGDRSAQDTDFCTNFGAWRPLPLPIADQSTIAQKLFSHHDGGASGTFRAIGQNVLTEAVYDLEIAQFAELLSRQGEDAYSWPEYVSRGILLAGCEYFLLYDRLYNQVITHRFSWFVRKDDAFPLLVPLRGRGANIVQSATQFTEIETEKTKGRWYDGAGDSLMLVSHRSDLAVEPRAYGCRVRADGIDDITICCAEPVTVEEAGLSFDGTIGLLRKRATATELALIRGTRIGVDSFTIHVVEGRVGIAAKVEQPGAGRLGTVRGRYHAAGNASFAVSMEGNIRGRIYVDGTEVKTVKDRTFMRIACEPGLHFWEWNNGLPMPIGPEIQRTEYFPGSVRVVAAAAAGATRYKLQWSGDDGATWREADASSSAPMLVLRHPQPAKKYHVRLYAENAEHRSAPGAEYPVYPTEQPPPAPDGLRLETTPKGLAVSWGEVLGAMGYRVYASHDANKKPQVAYSGPQRQCTLPLTGQTVLISVTAISGLGEGTPCRPCSFPDPFLFAVNETADHRFRRSMTAADDTLHPNDSLSRYYPE